MLAAFLPSLAGTRPTGVELDPPRGGSAAAYLDAVANDRLQADIAYLDPSASIQAPVPTDEPVDYAPAFEAGGWVVLDLVLLFVIVLAHRRLVEIKEGTARPGLAQVFE